MNALTIDRIAKSYNGKSAVSDLSFTVDKGETLGLIGPNGAGKTSAIRMTMDLLKPDSGKVTILGRSMSEATKNKIGYLPEERGLYKTLTVRETIVYLASLKGMDKRRAEEKGTVWLDKMGMSAARNKKIKELSKGMAQLIQFIVSIIHDPEILILDEPFSGLDPVNTELLKKFLADFRRQGAAVILSTHQMNQVEELCDRVLMMNGGKAVLYGNLAEIKTGYDCHSILLQHKGELARVAGVVEVRNRNDGTELLLDGSRSPQRILKELVEDGVEIVRFEAVVPSLNEIFLAEVGNHG